ncbi:MAG TPA: LPS export ABC transporter permease LptG [Burkholderiales bacterium]|nr:LPS export ABC transporter permease LptG [Betaproteobacteria bacterium]HQR53334.1 LPS export ABC transporter permease LptG [Burkholderiales bacterium]
MRIVRRYLFREIAAATLLTLAALLALFAFFDLLNQLEDLGRGQYRLHTAFLYVLLSLPTHVYEVMPIAVLVGALFALARLTAQSEYAILRTSGISMLRLAATLAQIGLVFAALTFVFGEYVAPASEAAAQRLRMRASAYLIVSQFRSGIWVKDGNSFVNVGLVTPDNTLLNIYLYDFDDSQRLVSSTFAKKGAYRGGNGWLLSEVARTRFADGRATVEHIPEMAWTSVLTPSLLGVLLLKPEEMAATDLVQYIEHLKNSRQQTTRYETALWSKLIYPFSVVLMTVLALPFAHFQGRMTSVGTKVFTGILVGLTFFLLGRFFDALGTLNNWTPFVSAVLPTLLFSAVAAWMIWRAERR